MTIYDRWYKLKTAQIWLKMWKSAITLWIPATHKQFGTSCLPAVQILKSVWTEFKFFCLISLCSSANYHKWKMKGYKTEIGLLSADGWTNTNQMNTILKFRGLEEQNWSSLHSFQAILGWFFSCERAAITWTSDSFGFFSVFLLFLLFKAGTEGEPNSNFGNDCSETGCTRSEVKQQNSCDDMFSAEDMYVQARWWAIIIIKKITVHDRKCKCGKNSSSSCCI